MPVARLKTAAATRIGKAKRFDERAQPKGWSSEPALTDPRCATEQRALHGVARRSRLRPGGRVVCRHSMMMTLSELQYRDSTNATGLVPRRPQADGGVSR